MEPTPYADANQLIAVLFARLQSLLGSKLVGLYLEGSLVLGDFDPKTSDIDLLAAVSGEIDDAEYAALEEMHANLVKEYPQWDDRVEVCYISVEGLQSVKTIACPIINISPGEPFHRTEAKKEWIMNWYLTRESSKTLFGPPPKTLIEPISHAEYIQSVKDHARSWDQWVEDMRNRYAQSYAIFSLCRALYSVRNGKQVSKKQAALWAKAQLPEWAGVIQNAIDWKDAGRDTEPDEVSFQQTRQFVLHVRRLILEAE